MKLEYGTEMAIISYFDKKYFNIVNQLTDQGIQFRGFDSVHSLDSIMLLEHKITGFLINLEHPISGDFLSLNDDIQGFKRPIFAYGNSDLNLNELIMTKDCFTKYYITSNCEKPFLQEQVIEMRTIMDNIFKNYFN